MDEIEEIVRLEGKASVSEKATSEERWAASRLCWKQLQEKSYRDLGEEIKSYGGKGSVGHLQRMKKSWEVTGMLYWDSGVTDFSEYPNFTDVYQSDEVRGKSEDKPLPAAPAQEERTGERGGGYTEHETDSDDSSASGLVRTASRAITRLYDNPSYWPLLSPEDDEVLNDLFEKIGTILNMYP